MTCVAYTKKNFSHSRVFLLLFQKGHVYDIKENTEYNVG